MLKALTERVLTARKVRMTLRNMMIGIVVREDNDNGTGPEVLEVGGEGVGWAAQRLRKLKNTSTLLYIFLGPVDIKL